VDHVTLIIYMCVCAFIYLFIHLFIHLFICLIIYLFMCVCMHASIHTAYRAYNACIYERGNMLCVFIGRLDNSFIGWLPVKGSGAESW
jgi:hypothetical protein